jgi:hypothetical protein
MRAEYDFSKTVKKPYATQPKKQITIRLDEERPTCIARCPTRRSCGTAQKRAAPQLYVVYQHPFALAPTSNSKNHARLKNKHQNTAVAPVECTLIATV